ncbi:MAG: hypothetical protein HY016_11535 [Nitrosomonadales bacterium]|nr:hypothetical protein [Nitrosomonadales bacterium]
MKNFIAALAMLVISIQATAQGQFSLGTGFDFSSGKYGNAISTDILYIPVVGKYEIDDLTLKLTIPYISITGPGGVVQGMGPVAQAGGQVRRTDSGLGDVVASADYNFYSVGPLALDVLGKIKLGTADVNKGLGTGSNSYAVQLDGYYAIDKVTLFATAGYRIYATPVGFALNNVLYGTIGASQKLNNTTSVGAMLDMATSSSPAGANQLEATIYISQKITPKLKVQANVMKGFSNGSPDFGGGAMITSVF